MSLKPATTYYYRVKAVSSTGESDYSNVISVTTNSSNDFAIDKQNPSTPVLSKVVVSSDSLLVYLVSPPSNQYVEEYKVSVSTVSDFSSFVYQDLTYLTNLNLSKFIGTEDEFDVLNIGNLTPNTLYYVRIKAVNSESSSNNLSFSRTTATVLDPPIALGASAIGTTEARIQWTSVDNATGYRLDVSPNPDFTANVVDNVDNSNALFRDITGLTAGTTYYVRVRAYNASTTSPNSNIVSFNTTTSGSFAGLGRNIPNISITNIFNIDNSSFSFQWESREEADYYELDISTASNFSSFIVEAFQTKKTYYKATGLSPATTYYIRVRAVNEYTSTANATGTVNTLAVNSSLNPPIAINSGNIKSSSFEAQWVKRTYALRYKLELSTDSNFNTLVQDVILGDVDSFVFDNLQPNTTYYFRVYALNNLNISQASNVIQLNTLAALPAITSLQASYVDGLRLSWTGSVSYVRYFLTIYDAFNNSYLGNGLFKFFDVGNVTNFSIDSFLQENTEYIFFVTGETSSGDRRQSSVATAYVPAISPRIKISNDSSTINWTRKLNRLQAAYDQDFKFTIPGWAAREVDENSSSFNIESLSNKEVNFYVRGYYFNNSTPGRYSNIDSLITSDIKFLKPKVTSTTATIKWLFNASLYRYRVYKKVSNDWVLETSYAIPASTNQSSVTLVDLDEDTEYKIEVQYRTGNTFSLFSLPVEFKTNKVDNVADIPTEASLDEPTCTIDNVSFDQAILALPDDYSYYLIEISDRSDFIYIERYLEATNGKLVIPCSPDKEYYLRIYGVDTTQNKKSNFQALSFSTLEISENRLLITTAPVLSNLVEINAQEASFQWTIPTNSTDFKIEVSQSNNFAYLEKDITVIRSGLNRAILSGFYSSNIYYIRMYAYNSFSISPYSNILTLDLS